MYVVDAGRALAALTASDVRGPVYIATGDAPPARELVMLVAEAVGRPDLVRFGGRPSNPADPAEIRADTSRLRAEVGWDNLTPHYEAIRATVDWWHAQGTRTYAAHWKPSRGSTGSGPQEVRG